MEVNAGSIIEDNKNIGQVDQEISGLSICDAAGDQTCAEINHSTAFSYLKQGLAF
jgi:altronate dehydratase